MENIPVIPAPSIFDYKGFNLFDIPGINQALDIDPNPLSEQVEMWFHYEKILEKMYNEQKKHIRIKKYIK